VAHKRFHDENLPAHAMMVFADEQRLNNPAALTQLCAGHSGLETLQKC
jgi:hypothetical protein